ncbi:MAG: hypothetical protein K2X01_09295 [Cyanobacteria bacterium]|nr:hypothetical protein [Cyanobacteriota bacterium]
MTRIPPSVAAPIYTQPSDWLVNASHAILNSTQSLPKKAEKLIVSAKPGQALSVAERVQNFFAHKLSWLGGRIFDYDFHEFPKLSKLKISEPPMGALFLILYPFTVGPRLYRAYERGKKNNDYREMGDVLRRDLTAITIFLFMLKPLVNTVCRLREKTIGVSLTKMNQEAGRTTFDALKYTDFSKNYHVANADVLESLIRYARPNGYTGEHGILKAARNLHDGGLAKTKTGSSKLSEMITAFQEKLGALVGAVDRSAPQAEVNKLKHQAFDALEKMDTIRAKAIQAAEEGGSAQALGALKNIPEYKGFLAKFARRNRMFLDVGSFLAVCVMIGWFPVWFNDVWNNVQYRKKKAEANANAPAFNAAEAYQSLKQSSRLSGRFINA